jgi:hypothetical protein
MINLWKPEPDPILHQALGKLAEELAEAAKAASRCLIQGFDACEPVTGKQNSEALIDEIADIEAAFSWLAELRKVNNEAFNARVDIKLEGFRRWQAMLEDDAAKREDEPCLEIKVQENGFAIPALPDEHDLKPGRYKLYAVPIATPNEPVGVRCLSCGSSWDDQRLNQEREKNPELKSCCPERKIVPVYVAPPAASAFIAKHGDMI